MAKDTDGKKVAFFDHILSTSDLAIIASLLGCYGIVTLNLCFPHNPRSFEVCADFLLSAFYACDTVLRWKSRPPGATTVFARCLEILSCLPTLGPGKQLGLSFVTLSIIGANRFLRAYLLKETLAFNLRHKLVPRRVSLLSIGVMALVVIHSLSIAWILINPSDDAPALAYNKAVYWTVTTLTTTGYGDIIPTTSYGRVYTMVVMILGATIYGTMIASVSRIMLASDRRKELRKEKMQSLQSFFDHYDIPKDLQQQVTTFYHHLFSKKVSDDEHAVISELPNALQSELHVYMNLKPISKVSLFKGCSFNCLSDAAKRLEPVLFNPGELIIRRGDIGHEMYVIGHGSVTIHAAGHFIATLEEGQCFGEMALIEDAPRTADATAASYCDIYKLSKERFQELTQTHADLRANIARVADERKKNSAPPIPLNKVS